MFSPLLTMETRKRKTLRCGVPDGDDRQMRLLTPASRFGRVSCDRMHHAVDDVILQVSRSAASPIFIVWHIL